MWWKLIHVSKISPRPLFTEADFIDVFFIDGHFVSLYHRFVLQPWLQLCHVWYVWSDWSVWDLDESKMKFSSNLNQLLWKVFVFLHGSDKCYTYILTRDLWYLFDKINHEWVDFCPQKAVKLTHSLELISLHAGLYSPFHNAAPLLLNKLCLSICYCFFA